MESVLAFGLLLGFMVLIHEVGHFTVAKLAGIRVEEFGIGFPPRLFAFRRGETEYSLNLIPLGGFVRMLGEEDPGQPRSFARAKKRWRIAILLAGSFMNMVAAALFFTVAYTAGWPTVTQTEVEIFRVVPGSPAERAGMQRGDVVLTLAGEPVVRTGDVRRITEANLGKTTPMEVRRGDNRLTLEVTPRTQWPEGDGPLGVGILDGPAKVEPVRYPPPEAAVRGVRELGRSIVLTLSVPVLALQGLVPLEFLRPVGPVGLFQATSQAAAETARSGWWFPILYMGASLGAGLGVANLLPIPGLDGGRLVFVLIEAIRGRRIAPEREGLIHLVGMAVLVSLVIVITYFDILFPVAVDFTLR
ncbi:MAG TPA: M50 family metallopeptidase [Chloroflexota bacterium]